MIILVIVILLVLTVASAYFAFEEDSIVGAIVCFLFGLSLLVVFGRLITDKDMNIYSISYKDYNTLVSYSKNLDKVTPELKVDFMRKINEFNRTLLRKRKLNKSVWYDVFISDEIADYKVIKIK